MYSYAYTNVFTLVHTYIVKYYHDHDHQFHWQHIWFNISFLYSSLTLFTRFGSIFPLFCNTFFSFYLSFPQSFLLHSCKCTFIFLFLICAVLTCLLIFLFFYFILYIFIIAPVLNFSARQTRKTKNKTGMEKSLRYCVISFSSA